ncbi:hypothetical protein VNI00_001787 [Paramarasmius palmivorus]|uniref:Uncharacterized protein n=1 Tax=Paramarasmius palmivorus TaxID=297713 RepID=A0AAW0E3E4_9AGAR
MNRPRISILEQFDPLLSEEQEPATPTALDSDYEEDSEKENAVPEPGDITMTTFFTRVAKPSYPTPKKLTKRLIDVGDTTINETALDIPEEEEEEDDDGESGSFCLPATPKATAVARCNDSSPRTPLADITLHQRGIASPLPRKKTFLCSPEFPKRQLGTPPVPSSSLSFAINSVNTAGTSFGRSQSGTAPQDDSHLAIPPTKADDGLITQARSRTPEIQIQISEEEEDLRRSENLLNKVSAPFTMSVNEADTSVTSLLTPPIPRSNPVNLSADRRSLDLHASFQLHLQSPESSFDLLNDKISFLDGHSREMNSFSLDEEDTAEEVIRQDAEDEEDENTPIATPVDSLTPERAPSSQCRDDESKQVECQPDAKDVSETLATPNPSQPLSLLAAERGVVLSTPGYKNHVPYVPPVPALRIMKRTKKFESGKTVAQPSNASPAVPTLQEGAEILRKAPSPPNVIARPGSSASTSSVSSSSSNEAKPRSTVAPVRAPVTRSSQPQLANPRGPMPMRVPIADSSSAGSSAPKQNPLIRRPPLPKLSGATTPSTTSQPGPRRVLVTETSSASATKKSDALSMAKQAFSQVQTASTKAPAPVRLSSTTATIKASGSGSSGFVSGLPRPGSRLPTATSGIARLTSTRSASGFSRK